MPQFPRRRMRSEAPVGTKPLPEAMGWDQEYLYQLRLLLHQEPTRRGLGYNEYSDEVEEAKKTMTWKNKSWIARRTFHLQ